MKKIIKSPIFIISLVAILVLVAWYVYTRRWRDYEDYGKSNWAGTTDFPEKLAFRTNTDSGLKVGDKVLLEPDAGGSYMGSINGEAVVIEIITPSKSHHGDNWFVVDKGHPGSEEGMSPGRFKKA